MPNSSLQEILDEDPSLIWYVSNKERVSDASIMEHVLNYGNWAQVQKILSILGKAKEITLNNKHLILMDNSVKKLWGHKY